MSSSSVNVDTDREREEKLLSAKKKVSMPITHSRLLLFVDPRTRNGRVDSSTTLLPFPSSSSKPTGPDKPNKVPSPEGHPKYPRRHRPRSPRPSSRRRPSDPTTYTNGQLPGRACSVLPRPLVISGRTVSAISRGQVVDPVRSMFERIASEEVPVRGRRYLSRHLLLRPWSQPSHPRHRLLPRRAGGDTPAPSLYPYPTLHLPVP